jgi:pimeloyl-ACP methyl ester carboxylesterase
MPEFERDGLTLWYDTFGAPESPAVVLLHGYTADSRMWAEHWQALEQDYFVIVPEMRAHGRSTAPDDLAAYSLDAYVADLAALLDSLSVELCAVVGCSFGGMVALQFATTWPERVAALVVSDAGGAYMHQRYDDAYRERERGIDVRAAAVAEKGIALAAKKAAATVNDEFLSHGVRAARQRASANCIVGGAHARRTRPSQLGLLDRLTMPVLVCIGSEDPVFSAAEVLIEGLPAARYVIFQGAGHGLPALRPGPFLDQLFRFLGDVEEGKDVAGRHTVAAESRG